MQMQLFKWRVVPCNAGLCIITKHQHKTIYKWSAVDIRKRLLTREEAIYATRAIAGVVLDRYATHTPQ